MSRLERLNTFIEVTNLRGFTAAARSLGVSTAAVSKQITVLERELGIQLIHRTSRSFELTEAGRVYCDYCRHTIDRMKEADRLIAHLKDEPSGVLRVNAAFYFGEKFIIPNLKGFLDRYPKLRVDLEFSERMPNLFGEQVDILFGVSMAAAAEIFRKKIAQTRYTFCASPEYLKKFGMPKYPRDLVAHRYITHGMRNPDSILRFGSKTEIHLTPILRLHNTSAMLECCLNGIGIIKTHHYVVEEAIRQKKLVEILGKYVELDVPVYLYYQPSKYLQPKVRRFIDFFSEKMKTLSVSLGGQ